MQFDRLDQTFLNHATLLERPGGLHAVDGDSGASPTGHSLTTVEGPSVGAVLGNSGDQQEASSTLEMCEGGVLNDVLAMLLTAVPDQWETLANRVVDARNKGHRIIAIAGHHAQEGRTTVVRGIAAVLRSHGWQVRCLSSSQELRRELTADSGRWQQRQDVQGCGESHENEDVTLVDSGVWFSPGPFRKQDIASRVFGCDAVLLVRHADVAPCPSRQQLLLSLGVFPIGEVVTFSGEKECGPSLREVLKSSSRV